MDMLSGQALEIFWLKSTLQSVIYYLSLKSRAAEFMQYLSPEGAGPSPKT